jgi:hypothetical protein
MFGREAIAMNVRTLAALAFASALALASPPSQALTFNFSFTGALTPGGGTGTVTGTIFGLQDNMTNEQATEVVINSAPHDFPITFPLSVPASVINHFTVSNGVIDTRIGGFSFLVLGWDCAVGITCEQLLLNPSPSVFAIDNNGQRIAIAGGSPDFSAVVERLDPTPLPAALPLFATGLGALALLGWRRKRKQTA